MSVSKYRTCVRPAILCNDGAGCATSRCGPTDLWHVENGMIVVRSKAEPPTGSTYLLWEGGEPKDFEFKCELKLEGAGANSGVQFRSVKLGEVPTNPRSRWETRGYQADLD